MTTIIKSRQPKIQKQNTTVDTRVEKIAILTDSCTDTPQELREKYPIYTVALHVNYKDKSYLDRVNITPEEVYARLDQEVPTTSTPSVTQVTDAFIQIAREGLTHVVCINISSNLSGTSNLVEHVSLSFPELETATIDTLNIGFGGGFMVNYACELLEQGASFDEIVMQTKEVVKKTHTFFVVDTLEYLYQGGRISKAVYALGSILNLKPIITCDEYGKYVVAAKGRGKKGALKKAKQLIAQIVGDKPFSFAVMNGNATNEAARILAAAKAEFPGAKKIIDGGQVSPVLTVHTGPGLVGMAIQLA